MTKDQARSKLFWKVVDALESMNPTQDLWDNADIGRIEDEGSIGAFWFQIMSQLTDLQSRINEEIEELEQR